MKITYANGALLTALLVAGTAAAQGVVKSAGAASTKANPPAAAANDADLALFQAQCSTCHGTDQVTAQTKTADEWAETIDRMIDHGMQITPEDRKRITAFLVAHYGPGSSSK